MNPRDLWRRKSGWERMPDVVSSVPRVLGSSLAALDAASTALDSTMEAMDAAKMRPKTSRSIKREKPGRRSPIRRGLIAAGSVIVIGLGSAAVSSVRRRENHETHDAS
jgi:hypothetical protein